MTVVRSAVVLGLVGLVYAVALRAWMRFVTPDPPEFTWTGTAIIVLSLTVLGATAGLARGLRRIQAFGSVLAVRIVGLVLSLSCFLAAGILMIPTVVPAGVGVGRYDWWRGVRIALIATGVVAAVAIVATTSAIDDDRRLVGGAIYLLLCPVEVALFAHLVAPMRPGSARAR